LASSPSNIRSTGNVPNEGSLAPLRRASRTSVDLLLGQLVDGEFEVQNHVGQGSHADVYRAVQRSVANRVVALKVLSRHYLSLSESDFRRAAQTLQREGELLGGLHAACFVNVYRTGVLPDNRPYIALEFAEGKTLAQLIHGGKRLPVPLVIGVLHQWAEGLAELHARGWVHRDVTPANAVVSDTVFHTERLQVYDFGTASQVTGRPDRFRTGYDRDRPQGTAAYMSPEVAQGSVVTGASDQFQLAAMAYEFLAGARPVQVGSAGNNALLDYLRGAGPIPVRPLSELRPDLPAAVGEAVARALQRDPEQRFAGVQHFVEALTAACQGAEPEPAAAPGLVERLLARMAGLRPSRSDR
jgi:serine/threonine-protein kinase